MSRCFTPIEISPKLKNYNGKSQKSDSDQKITVPCGQCIGCRMNRAENWAARMMHEAQLHEHIPRSTLTYSDDNLPANGSLAPDDVTLFFKRLRKRLNRKKILYYYCGEYGENFSRPHYHIALFNHDFHSDRLPHRETQSGTVYRSSTLESLWPFGFSEIGNLEYDSARYIAGYIQKKVNGKKQDEHYTKLDEFTGELTFLTPEFARMSRRPAIGLNWIQQYHSDIYNYDVCEVGSKKLRPPAYYDKWLKKTDEQKFQQIKLSREASMLDAGTTNMHDLTYTYEAKVIASKKIQRSLEGMPAHSPDGDRLDYYKQRRLENHFWQKENK
ncbi:MAG: replication associated protein [Microviridae sp. ctITQ3]|nr:MAG: replication associated protein [Microviridae sp. ctITQ3]